MIQLAAGIAQVSKSQIINKALIEKVVNNGRFAPRPEVKPNKEPMIGTVNGLAVYGANVGTLIEVEAASIPVTRGKGKWTVTGVVEEEQVGGNERKYTRKSMARGAVENVLTVLRSQFKLNIDDYDIHLNFPGGIPVDGPSAGISMATAIYSSVLGRTVDNMVAMTGEVSVHGKVKPVGGVISKVDAARKAGLKRVFIPAENWLDIFGDYQDIDIIPVREVREVLENVFVGEG